MELKRITSLMITGPVFAVLSACVSYGQQSPNPFAHCEKWQEAEPDNPQSAQCFFETARREALWEEAGQELATRRALHPDNPWLYINSGHVLLFSRHPQKSEEYYLEALRIAQRLRQKTAEIEARLALARFYAKTVSNLEEADEVLRPAVTIAEQEEDPILLAKVRIRQAWQFLYRGTDLDYAHHLLKEVEQGALQDASGNLTRQWLDAMAVVSYNLGRNEEYLRCKERLLAMALEAGDRALEAAARFDIAIQYLATELPTVEARRRAQKLFEAALVAAEAADHPSIEGQAHRVLGKMLPGEEGRKHLESCIDIAEALGDVPLLNQCRGALAVDKLREDRGQARELVEQILADISSSSDPWSLALGWEERLPVHWATLPRDEAIERSFEVLDSLESLRELQSSGSGRARLISVWSGIYYWLSGRLLDSQEPAADPQRETDLELAFTVTERMRARVLLEALEASRASTPPPADEPLMVELEKILDRKVDIQRRWIGPRLTTDERTQLRELLDRVEQEEESVRQKIERAYPTFAATRPRALVSLDEIEESLGEDEALLSFQLSLDTDFYGRFAGGSWLLVVTRDGSRSYRLPGLVDLDPRLKTVLGFERPENAIKGYARLYHDLMAAAVDELPAAVDKLTIIADGKLHRLPFAFLRESEDAAPLISRYQLSMAPSAKLWLRWRHSGLPESQAPVLVFADPTVTDGSRSEDAADTREWDLVDGATLDPLPHAREEGAAIVGTLGGASRLLEGSEATEEVVKSPELRNFGIIHFAAHAFIDEQKPERSMVLLAPGIDGEDGWLQPWEIVDLELDGRVVVLASCRTAVGEVLRGEGPMSLARAFFRAEAPVVVAGLWQLPDAGTSSLIQSFYRHLARGASVAEAMAMAQRKMIRRGASGKDWAGLVVLGNGAMVPFPGGLPRPIPYLLIAAVAAVLAAGAFLIVRRRRSLQR